MAAAQEADEPPRRPPTAAALKKNAPGQPWSHGETMHLIDVYEERWTKQRRGQLKAQQWEDVAAEVTARCSGGGGAGAASGQRKTGTQCRHKLEKLRKRYRTESARPVTSLWPFFRRMERLERGPLPVSTFPPNAASPPTAASASDEEEVEEEEEEDDEEEQELLPRNNTRSINGILRESSGFRGFAPPPPQPQQQQQPPPPPAMMLSTAPPRKRVTYEAFQPKPVPERVKVEEAPVGRSGEGVNAQFSGLLRDFGEGIMRLERRRMEVQWEIEREWKEMEARHNNILLDAQRQLQDTLAAAAAAPPPGKKTRREHGSSGDGL